MESTHRPSSPPPATRWAVLVLLLISTRLSGQGPAHAEWVLDTDAIFEGNAPLGDDGSPKIWARQICDLETGAPLRDARVWVLESDPRGVEGRRFTMIPGDGDGWVRLESGSTAWAYVEAPGHAPMQCEIGAVFCGTGLHKDERHRFGSIGLRRAWDVPVEVRDWLDRPMSQVRVEVGISEGDDGIPAAVRAVTTDTLGRCVIPSVTRGIGTWISVIEGTSRLGGLPEGDDQRPGRWEPGFPPLIVRAQPLLPDGSLQRLALARPGDVIAVTVETSGMPTEWAWEGRYTVIATDPVPIVDGGELHEHTTINVPTRGRCALHLQAAGRTKVVEVSEEARRPGAAPIRVAFVEPVKLPVRLVDDAGCPVKGWVEAFGTSARELDYCRWDPKDEDLPPPRSEHLLAVHPRGEIWLYACAPGPGRRPVRVPMIVPRDDTAQLSPVVLRLPEVSTSRVQVLLPDGTPAADAVFERMHHGLVASDLTLDETGSIGNDEPALRSGETIRVRHDGLPVPFFPKLRGSGPWTIRWPGAGLRIRVRSTTGAPIKDCEVVLDLYVFHTGPDTYGFQIQLQNSELSIPGLEAGPHRLIVAARGHRARIEQLVLRENEVRAIDAVLKPLSTDSAPTVPR